MHRAHTASRLLAQRNILTWQRLNATLAHSASPSSSKSLPPPGTRTNQPRKWLRDAEAIRSDNGPNSVRVRFDRNPRHSADVLAAVQYVESLFGPVDEFNCRTEYGRRSMIMFIRFRDYESRTRALEHSHNHRIPAPRTNHGPLDGGIGLSDLTPYLEIKDKETGPGFELDHGEPDSQTKYDANPETLSFKILPSDSVQTAQVNTSRRFLPAPAVRSFLQWRGFAPIEPLPTGTPLLESESGHETQGDAATVDHPIMRFVIQRYAKMSNVPNPLERNSAKLGETAQPKREWRSATAGTKVEARTKAEESEESQTLEDAVAKGWEHLDSESTAGAHMASPSVISPSETESGASASEAVLTLDPDPSSTSTPAPTASASAPPPESESEIQPPPASTSPEALAQMKAANSLLKRLNQKPKPTLTLNNVSSAQTPSQSRTQAKAQVSKTKKASRPSTVSGSTSTPGSSSKQSAAPQHTAQESSTQGEPKEEAESDKSRGAASKLRGFMGKWF